MGYLGGEITANIAGNYNIQESYVSLNMPLTEGAGAGSSSAALAFGGVIYMSYHKVTEKFNGTNWILDSALLGTTSAYASGLGTQSSAVSCANIMDADGTEKYNGTSWSTGNNMVTGNYNGTAFGITTSATQCGGSYAYTTTQNYDGTNWSSSGAKNYGVTGEGGAGTQTAGLAFQGYNSASVLQSTSEEFSGTTWTVGNDCLNIAGAVSGCGTQTAALSCGNNNYAMSIISQKYNGTTWELTSSLNYGRGSAVACGTTTAAIIFGGQSAVSSMSPSGQVNTHIGITEMFDGTVWSILTKTSYTAI